MTTDSSQARSQDLTARLTRQLLRALPGHLRSRLVWFLSKRGLLPVPDGRVSCTVDGLAWSLDLRDGLQRRLYYFGSYEQATLDRLTSFLRGVGATADRASADPPVFVDVGANVGLYSMTVAHRCREAGQAVAVWAVEPGRETGDRLTEGLGSNGLSSVELVRCAFTADDTPAMELRHRSDVESGDLGLRSFHGEGEVTDVVVGTRFDDWFKHRGLKRLDAMKIDVEGHEVDVLRGMRCGEKDFIRPRMLIIERQTALLDLAGRSSAELDAELARVLDPIEDYVQEEVDGNVVYRLRAG